MDWTWMWFPCQQIKAGCTAVWQVTPRSSEVSSVKTYAHSNRVNAVYQCIFMYLYDNVCFTCRLYWYLFWYL